jgi:hypothetical protein
MTGYEWSEREGPLIQYQQFFDVAISYFWRRPSFVTGDEWSQRD